MEKQVLIPLREYEQLKLVKKAVDEGEIIEYKTDSWGGEVKYVVVDKSEYFARLENMLDDIHRERKENSQILKEIASALKLGFFGFAKKRDELIRKSFWIKNYINIVK